MAIFKCKMCGGTLEINNNETVAVCEYCGTKQTLPKLDDEKRVQLYDRANHFRRENEFDKAMGIYEMILSDDKEDCESYWGIVLCRYGIEYVEDPRTHKRIPTVNRAQFTSIFDDDDYKNAIKYADGYQKDVYEAEASVIDKIQKGILEISNKEEPFDVFICYKETDSHGNRTQDSVYAQDIYAALTKEGYKVFFSRITLEDKLGSAYEPYIFAALNSAKVMLVVGTEKDNFNAVWVKNEWSRYISLIKAGKDKTLIPVYKDISPYDMPKEFQYLQSQDMGKIGFMQDLIRGISKLIDTNKTEKETFVVSGGNTNVAPLLERAFMFLEDADWANADEYCEKVLDLDPKNAEAYLGKLMAELKVRRQEELVNCTYPFSSSVNYEKILRYGSNSLTTEVEGYIEKINARIEAERLEETYNEAKLVMSIAKTEDDYKNAANKFELIDTYKDSASLSEYCFEKAEIARKDTILSEGKSEMSVEIISNYESAIKLFETISGWRDADEQIIACQKKIEEIKAMAEAERLEKERKAEIARKEAERIAKRNKKIATITTPIVCAIIAFIIVLNTVIIPNGKYNDAIALMDAGKYTEAISAFEALDGYKDSSTKITECNYNDAITLMDAGNIVEAFEALVALDGYKDSADKANSIYYQYKIEKLKVAKAGDYVFFGEYEQDNNTANGKEDIEWLVLEVKDGKALVISKYALDCKPYNTSYTDVTWETCTLRKWLNNDFLGAAFSADEKAMIPAVTVSADKNPDYSTNPGNATQDQAFLLSITEANKYFSSDSVRQCEPTDFAVANGAWESDSGNCRWLLRSPGDYQFYAAEVNIGGDVNEYGYYVIGVDRAVRPALWIAFDS